MRTTSLISLIVVAGLSVGFASCGGESPIEPTPVCSFAISPAAGTFASDGGAATVTVTVAAGCAWNATSNVEWIVVTAGTTGSGPGTVAYSVNANSSTQSRSGVVTIGGQGHAVTQQGRPPVVCTYAVEPDNSSFGNDGGTRTFTVNAPAECAWTAVSDASWLIVTTGGQGTGNGTVSYTVAANGDTSDRVAQIAVADRRFTVRQGGNLAACQYSVGPVEFSPCMPAGSVTATLDDAGELPVDGGSRRLVVERSEWDIGHWIQRHHHRVPGQLRCPSAGAGDGPMADSDGRSEPSRGAGRLRLRGQPRRIQRGGERRGVHVRCDPAEPAVNVRWCDAGSVRVDGAVQRFLDHDYEQHAARRRQSGCLRRRTERREPSLEWEQ